MDRAVGHGDCDLTHSKRHETESQPCSEQAEEREDPHLAAGASASVCFVFFSCL